METPWDEWNPDADDATLGTTCIRQVCKHARFFGPIELEIESDHIHIFDWMFHVAIGNSTKNYFQTVVIIKPESLELPPFLLLPRSHNLHLRTSQIPKVKTETALDLTNELESLLPFRLKSLFHSQIGQDELIPFLTGRDWTVQWTEDRLIVYKLNELVAPEQIQHFALQVSDFLHLLKSAPEDVDRHMNEFIDQAVQATSYCRPVLSIQFRNRSLAQKRAAILRFAELANLSTN